MKIRFSLAFSLVTVATAFADTWNAATNFNSTLNPNASSVFSYGSGAPGGTFTAMFPGSPAAPGTPSDWMESSTSFCCATAGISWNGTGSQLNYFTVRQPANEVRLDPQNSAGAVVRFTAPTAAQYSFTGLFESIDIFQGGINWHAYSGASGSTLASGSIADSSFGSTSTFSLTTSLAGGDNVDFVVVTQFNGCCNRSVGLSLDVASGTSIGGGSETPEPASFGLIFLGLAGLAGFKASQIRLADQL